MVGRLRGKEHFYPENKGPFSTKGLVTKNLKTALGG